MYSFVCVYHKCLRHKTQLSWYKNRKRISARRQNLDSGLIKKIETQARDSVVRAVEGRGNRRFEIADGDPLSAFGTDVDAP